MSQFSTVLPNLWKAWKTPPVFWTPIYPPLSRNVPGHLPTRLQYHQLLPQILFHPTNPQTSCCHFHPQKHLDKTLIPRPISGPFLTFLFKNWNVLSPLNALFNSFWSGFWSHHNTKTALLRVTIYLLLSLDLVNSQLSFPLTSLQLSTSSSTPSAWLISSSPG